MDDDTGGVERRQGHMKTGTVAFLAAMAGIAAYAIGMSLLSTPVCG